MTIDRFRVAAAFAAVAVSLATSAAFPATAAENAAPTGVARLSDLHGSVQIRRSDTDQAYDAALNGPLGTGDYLTTGDDARAEVEFDHASVLRLAPKTQVRFVKLESGQHELQLADGTVEMRLFHGLDAHPLVDTPAATVIPDAEGRYRVTVTGDGNTEVTVRSGRADVQYGEDNQTRTIEPGSTFVLAGATNRPEARTIETIGDNAFDGWADTRDSRWNDTTNWSYADNGMVGANDLNQYGNWSNNAQYGNVWQPSDVPAGWSPYSDGRFVWEPYYGWTWVGYEPWGYAPYHYGRWFWDNGWYWYPGPAGPYAYAPALVGFFGYGDPVDDGWANIGWTPLAPYEAFTPWWGGGGSTIVVNNYYGGGGGYHGYGGGYGGGYGHGGRGGFGGGFPYQNGNAPGGSVGTSGGNFGSGHFEHIQPVTIGQHLSPILGSLPIAPTIANLAPSIHGIASTIHPISSHFNLLAPVKSALSFAQEQVTARSAIHSLAGTTSPAQGSRSNGDVWSRFDRGVSGPSYAVRDANDGSRMHAYQAQTGYTARGTYDSRGTYESHSYQSPASQPRYDEQSRYGEQNRYSEQPRYNEQQPRYDSQPRYNEQQPRYNEQQPRYNEQPRYSQPRMSEPHYSQPHYSAPHVSAPHYSAPHNSAPSHSSGGSNDRHRR